MTPHPDGHAWRRAVRWLPILTTLACLLPAPVLARQETGAGGPAQPPALVELRLRDGSVIYGTIEQESADRVVVRTIAGGTVEVPRVRVASLAPARGRVVDGEFWPADANATRLLFAPTGRALRRGQAYLGVYEFVMPFVQAGVTDRFSLGAGTPFVFFGDDESRPVWVTPKYQIYAGPKTSVAAGVMHFVVFGANSRAGLAYGVLTHGTDDNAVTAGLGWAYARYVDEDYGGAPCRGPQPQPLQNCTPLRTTKIVGSPVAMIGGERRLSRRTKIITENYAFEGGGIVSVGVRFLGDRLSADLGVFAPVAAEEFFLGPIVNFVWTFGK